MINSKEEARAIEVVVIKVNVFYLMHSRNDLQTFKYFRKTHKNLSSLSSFAKITFKSNFFGKR